MNRQAESDLDVELDRKYPGRRVGVEDDSIVIRIPMAFKKCGGRKEIILPDGADGSGAPAPQPQRPLVAALAKGLRWQQTLEGGQAGSIKDIARGNHVDPSYVARMLRLATLAPDIVEALLDGREPSGLSLRKLTGNLPLTWAEQRKLLGFEEN